MMGAQSWIETHVERGVAVSSSQSRRDVDMAQHPHTATSKAKGSNNPFFIDANEL